MGISGTGRLNDNEQVQIDPISSIVCPNSVTKAVDLGPRVSRVSSMFMFFILLVVFFSPSMGKIVERTPDQLVKESDTLTLSCVAEHNPVSLCSFVSPSGQRCGYSKDRVCPDRNVEFVRSAADVDNQKCTVRIKSVEERQNGQWKCEFKGPGSESDESALITVTVAKQAVVQFSEVYGTLSLISGESYKLGCEAKHGRPSGSFRWSMETTTLDTSTHSTEEKEYVDDQGFFNSDSVLNYVARKEDDEKRLYCHYDQRVNEESEVIFSQNDHISLSVFHLQVPDTEHPHVEVFNVQQGQDVNVTIHFEARPKPRDAADVLWKVGDVQLQIPDPWDAEGQGVVERRNFVTYGLQSYDNDVYSATMTIKQVELSSINKGELRVALKDSRDEDVLIQSYTFVLHEHAQTFDESINTDDSDQEGSSLLSVIVVVLVIVVIVALLVAAVLVAKRKELLCFERRGVARGGTGTYARP